MQDELSIINKGLCPTCMRELILYINKTPYVYHCTSCHKNWPYINPCSDEIDKFEDIDEEGNKFNNFQDEYFAEPNELNESSKLKSITTPEAWSEFSQHVHEYIYKNTMEKYLASKKKFDLIDSSMTSTETCLWNVIKYAMRTLNGKGKEHDLEKIAHYASFAWYKKNTKKND